MAKAKKTTPANQTNLLGVTLITVVINNEGNNNFIIKAGYAINKNILIYKNIINPQISN